MNSTTSGFCSTTPLARRSTTPSFMKAVLSATMGRSARLGEAAEPALDQLGALGRRLRQGRDLGALGQRAEAREIGTVPAIDEDQAMRRLAGRDGGRQAVGADAVDRARRQGEVGLLQGVERRVAPVLVLRPWQARVGETREAALAQRGEPRRRGARQAGARLVEAPDKAPGGRLGRCLGGGDARCGGHDLRRPRRRTRHSPSSRAPAPAPCRPSARCGPWPGYARRRARCSRAGADNA